uniref:WD repeat-containing protein 44 n=1 Tax=Caenorhabditis japonica TaxID=281687 RepID=A0A8R1I6Y4_CAEJA
MRRNGRTSPSNEDWDNFEGPSSSSFVKPQDAWNFDDRQRASRRINQTPSSNLSKPSSSKTSHDVSSHRERLIALRHRMNKEFGLRQLSGSSSAMNYEQDETMSTVSDAPSLHSWHHNMIGKHETVIVRASDTLSSCAGPSAHCADTSPTSPNSTVTRVPPPIPARGSLTSPSTSPLTHPPIAPMPRFPPPLPPRRPTMKLPDPIAIEVENRIEEERVKSNGVQRSETSSATASTPEVKGHKKTSSIDRGLTIAKAMKTGPFPPNALALGAREATGEEEERNVVAEKVINEITTVVESAAQSYLKNVESNSLETIPSASNSSASSCSSECSKLEVTIPVPESIAEEGEEEALCSSKSIGNLESANSLSPAKTIANRLSRSMSNDELRVNKADKLSSSVDPITLDVERRLSMKRSGQHEADRHSLGSLDDATSHRTLSRSGIGNAASFARNSVRYASGMLRSALKRVRIAAHPGTSSSRHEIGEETSDGDESDEPQHSVAPSNVVRPRKSKKGPYDFEHLTIEQELNNEHTGAIWCIKFSICGKLMATAGQDSILRIWVIRSHLQYFSDLREKYSSSSNGDADPMVETIEQFRPPSSMGSVVNSETTCSSDDNNAIFCAKPFAVLKGHTADILDISWSKNYFILSSGMDRTVKLWHLSRNECLCCFQHIDFVTCVAFLPKDDRYFLSGSLDGKLRMWHIPDKKVAVWNDTEKKYITAMTFVKSGKFAVVGTYDGKCIFYTSDQLKYHTAVDVRSSRGKNSRGHKVTGLTSHGDKLLVTSNDSRIRMYDIRDKALTCKFKGVQNDHSQIRAAFSPDGRHIICGSEDKFVYIWRSADISTSLSVRKDRNSLWERVRTHNAPVPVAVFAPRPQVFFNMLDKREKHSKKDSLDFNVGQSDSLNSMGNLTVTGHIIVSADLNGVIKVMVNRPRLLKGNTAVMGKSSRSRSSTTVPS